MGNCFGGHPVRHLSGYSTKSSAPRSTPSAASGAESSEKKDQAQGNGCNLETKRSVLFSELTGGNSTHNLHPFPYTDLKSATRNFRPDSLLGEGGFGSVFKGHIDENFRPVRAGQGMLIAVKKLNLQGKQGDKEWLAELKYLGNLKHPNLVRLIGYCCEDDHRILVYEFLTRGSLENHLFGRHQQGISWNNRLNVAIDAARGLTFLHDAEKPVIYRDFKTSNILLDSEFRAKLSDFGLAKDGPTGDKTHVTTQIVGTYGYAAPEYVATGRLTAKNDVYGFGVVLLEILTGKRAVDKGANGEERILVDWACPYLTDKSKWCRVLDQKLEGQYSYKEAKGAASIAMRCLQPDPKLRPTMKEVLHALERLRDPKNVARRSSRPASSHTASVREPTRTEQRNPNQNQYANAANQGQTTPVHANAANVFRLPSPQKVALRQQTSPIMSPLHSPRIGSPMVRQ